MVAVFFTVFDLLAARGPAFTLNLLGKMVFSGVRDPAILLLPIAPDMVAMVAYNFLHLFPSLTVGLFVAWLMARGEDRPRLGFPVFIVLVAGYLVTIVGITMFAGDVAQLLPWWTIVTGNPRRWRARGSGPVVVPIHLSELPERFSVRHQQGRCGRDRLQVVPLAMRVELAGRRDGPDPLTRRNRWPRVRPNFLMRRKKSMSSAKVIPSL